jgi:aspartate racemase
MKTIGILGGMGPQATVLLMQKVVDAVPNAQDDADHVPLIVYQNPQVPSRIAALIDGDSDVDPAPVLRNMAQTLINAGSQALAMPCNTAHHYAAEFEGLGVPFISMVDSTAAKLSLRASGGKVVGMLASPAVKLTGTFDAAFKAHQITALWVEEDALLELIQKMKRGHGKKEELQRIADVMVRQGADQLLVACTELSVLTDVLRGYNWVDSLDILVEEIVRFAKSD